MSGPRVAAGLAAILVLGAAAVILSASQPRLAGTNSIPVSGFATMVRPGAQKCMVDETIPAGTAAVSVVAQGHGGTVPDLGLTVGAAGRPLVAARGAPSGPAGPVTFPVPVIGRDVPGARVCFRNRGTATVALEGLGRPAPGTTIQYRRAGSESGWALIPLVAERVGRSGAGLTSGWAFWGALLLVAAAWAVAIAVVTRREPA